MLVNHEAARSGGVDEEAEEVGGARVRGYLTGAISAMRSMGRLQQEQVGQVLMVAASSVSGSGPTCSTWPVWKAMRSRLALAAGWQKPK